ASVQVHGLRNLQVHEVFCQCVQIHTNAVSGTAIHKNPPHLFTLFGPTDRTARVSRGPETPFTLLKHPVLNQDRSTCNSITNLTTPNSLRKIGQPPTHADRIPRL